MKRWLTRLLVVLLAPVVYVAGAPQLASAATTTVTVEFATGPGGSVGNYIGQSVDCKAVGYYRIGQGPGSPPPTVVLAGLACSTGWDISEARASFTAKGQGCQFGDGLALTDVDDGQPHEILLASFGTYVPSSCVITELCYQIKVKVHSNPWAGDEYGGCTTFGLGEPPPPPTAPPAGNPQACEYFDLSSISVDVKIPAADTDLVTLDVWVRGNIKDSRAGIYMRTHVTDAIATTPASYSTRSTNSADYGPATQGTGTPLASTPGASLLPNGGGFKFTGISTEITKKKWQGRDLAAYGGLTSSVLGVNVISGPYYPGTAAGQSSLPHKGVWSSQNRPFPNDPTNCRWFVGKPQSAWPGSTATVLDTMAPSSTTGSTTPFSELYDNSTTTPPEPDPVVDPQVPVSDQTCAGFSLTDPTSWAGAGICQLVKAMSALIKAVGGIAGAILNGLGNVFTALFVPDPSSWDLGDLQDQVTQRPPGSIVTDIAETADAAATGYKDASGCGTIADFQSEDTNAKLTCSSMKSTPGYGALFSLVQVGLWALTGLAMFNLFSSRFKEN